MDDRYGAYTGFAQVYDLFMDNVPYEEWGDYLQKILEREGIKDGLLLDLGCGTGRLTRVMAAKGFDMIGVDVSTEMLEIAREREFSEVRTQEMAREREFSEAGTQEIAGEREFSEAGTQDPAGCGKDPAEPSGILYLQQDMREFELYGTVRGIYSACDSLNYITDPGELLAVFRLVNNYLDPGGIFVFDCNTPYKYEQLLGENTFAENRREGSFIWENYYDAKEGINEYDLTLYIRSEKDRYQRFQETHFQRCYTQQQLTELLEEAGLEVLSVYDGYTFEKPSEDSERITIAAREKGKKAEVFHGK